jgi:thiamine monophosphate kinase
VGYGLVAELVLGGRIPLEEARGLLEHTRRPLINPALGSVISGCGASAASDNSDGWGFTIATLLGDRLDALVDSVEAGVGVLGLLSRYLDNPEAALFESKEDYSIAVAAGEEASECILEACRRLGVPCRRVGRVVEGYGRVLYRGLEVRVAGWEWF